MSSRISDRPRGRAPITALLALFAFSCAILAPGVLPEAPAKEMDVSTTPSATWRDDTALDAALAALVNGLLGLRESTVVSLPIGVDPGAPLSIVVPIDSVDRVVDLAPHSVRSETFQVLAELEDGTVTSVDPGPVRTMRGSVRDEAGSTVSASLLDDGLRATIVLPDGSTFWLEPVAGVLPGFEDRYVIYADDAVSPSPGTCGMPEQQLVRRHANLLGLDTSSGPRTAGSPPCAAELAADADVEYFNLFGSVGATQNRIQSIVNTVNLQYESQVGITHAITTILVRTAEPDPYTAFDSTQLLCQFITEWTNNQGAIPRDVAVLFTGRDINGSVIGQAADIGATGICQSQGSCTGGQFGTQGSYCIAQAEYNGNFSCATDLVAHELGHLWGAFHCSCPGNTMNSSITCANDFSAASITSIVAYRDTRPCLDGECGGGPEVPANDDCGQAEIVPATTTLVADNSFATPPFNGADPQLPFGSPSCQWSMDPSETHSTLWYAFVADSTSIEILTCATMDVQDTIIALYGGTCGNLVELACGEDDCGFSSYLSSICYAGLVPGNTYLLMVGCPGGWQGSVPGPITVQMQSPCPDASCPADVTGPAPLAPDGNVDALDLLLMISQWASPCTVGGCEADITGPTPLMPDGNVDSLDLLLLIGQWGSPASCP